MSKRNIKKIVVGFILIFAAIFGALIAFYYLEVKPTIEEDQITVVNPVDIVPASKKEPAPSAATIEKKPAVAPVSAPSVQRPAGNVVRERKEGFLWVDRKSSKLVITLGASQGIVIGDALTVYDNDQKIGTVVVSDVYDAIAYVVFSGRASHSFPNDYYRVVRE